MKVWRNRYLTMSQFEYEELSRDLREAKFWLTWKGKRDGLYERINRYSGESEDQSQEEGA